MKLEIKVEWIKELHKRGGTKINDWHYRNANDFATIPSDKLDDTDLSALRVIAQEDADKTGVRALVSKIDMYFKVKASPEKSVITRLEGLETALKAYIGTSAHKYLFSTGEDGQYLCWYVVSIAYTPYDARNERPAQVCLRLAAMSGRSKTDTQVIWQHDSLKKTVPELLDEAGYVLETPELVAEYEQHVKRYNELNSKTGCQYHATGLGYPHERHYSYLNSAASLVVDDHPSRVVMDDDYSDSDEKLGPARISVVTSEYWLEGKRKDNPGTEVDSAIVPLPLQPYVKVFDLTRHMFLHVHVCNLTEYVYDHTLVEKLVLEEDKKNLVSMLVTGMTTNMEDIIRGKTGGTIGILTGKPGLGKTLTAEIFAEEVECALYSVQCSQLGTNEKALEEKLTTVLKRAQRWKAILLIDEADVYVRSRGNDIQQNAIVGVFLRVLEHYRGALFLTSNRAFEIDDAIMSRATAWIQYTYPDAARLARIWKVLSTQYQVLLSDADIATLVNHPVLKRISGRTVKNLLKLARLLTLKNEQKVTPETIEYVSRFHDLDGQNSRKADSQRAADQG